MEESGDLNGMESFTNDLFEGLGTSPNNFQHMDGLGVRLEAVNLEQEESESKILLSSMKSETSVAFDLCTNTNQSIKTGDRNSSQFPNQNLNLGGTVTLINSESDGAKKGGRNRKRIKCNLPSSSSAEVNVNKDDPKVQQESPIGTKPVAKGFSSEYPGTGKPIKQSHILQLSTAELTQDTETDETEKTIPLEVDKDKRVASLFMCNGKATMTESRCGEMDKLPIELAHGETLVSLDGIDDIESIGGCSQENNDAKGEVKDLEDVTTATGEVIKLIKPARTDESGNKSQEIPAVETSPLHVDDGSFPCTLCTQRFSRKLYLNNHMEEQHGVKYVFTERGRKVKLVRIPKNYDPQNMDDLDPSIRKLIKKSAGCQDLSKVVGVVTEPYPDTDEAVSPVTESSSEAKSKEAEKEPEEGVECGFLVDKINTVPYQKALSRGEVPFCAFSPISTEDFYLLKIQDVSDSARHMLVPASKDDVFSTAGAVKTTDEQEPGNDDAMNYKVAIVAIARQQYSEQDKQFMVSVDPPLKKDKDKIACVRFLTLDKFADFAFLGFDGNVSEFAKNAEPDGIANPTAATGTDPGVSVPLKITSPTPSPVKEKTPPRAPARRGRGGRRRVSRKSPSMPSPSRPQQQRPKAPRQYTTAPATFTESQTQMLPPIANLPFPFEMAQDINQTFVKMEQADHLSETQFFTQMGFSQASNQMTFQQAPNQMAYIQDQPTAPMPVEFSVPLPSCEVTVGSDTGHNDENINHDIITIALDQLFPMTSGDGSNANNRRGTNSERGGRGGRRPGRKPGRRPAKDRDQNDNYENSFSGSGMPMPRQDGEMPKRRGRPPKNRVLMPISDPDFESVSADTIDTEEFDSLLLVDKRMKLHYE